MLVNNPGAQQAEPPLPLSPDDDSASQSHLAIVGLIFSTLGLPTLGLLSPVGLLISGVALFRSPGRVAFSGAVLGLLGTVSLALSIWLLFF